jgi:ABC-type uncharacterized transport system permease subunit
MTTRRPRNWFGWTGLVVSVLLLVVAALGLAAPYLASKWIEFDIFSHFRLHFIGVTAVALVAMFFRRMWSLILVVGICATPLMIAALPALVESPDTVIETTDGEVPVRS